MPAHNVTILCLSNVIYIHVEFYKVHQNLTTLSFFFFVGCTELDETGGWIMMSSSAASTFVSRLKVFKVALLIPAHTNEGKIYICSVFYPIKGHWAKLEKSEKEWKVFFFHHFWISIMCYLYFKINFNPYVKIFSKR